jgi:peptidylprolyl isomerase
VKPRGVVVVGSCAALALSACGDSSTEVAESPAVSPRTARDSEQANSPRTEVPGSPTPPRIRVPSGPPPKNLVVRELKKGSGAVAKHGKRLKVQSVGVNYKTGEAFEVFWGPGRTFSFNFGSGEVRDGWETGLKGMKVGGRRELILPSRLAYGTGALIYVVELVGIEK